VTFFDLAGSMSETPLYTQSIALIIGIDHYDDPLMSPLGAAEADARALAETLAAPPHSFQVRTLIGAEATKANILAALDDLTNSAPEDRLLVYFSGHSGLIMDRFGNERAFLSAADTTFSDDATALPLEEMLAFWTRAQAKHVAFFFDAPLGPSALRLTHDLADTPPDKFLEWRAGQVLSAGTNGRTISALLLSAFRSKNGCIGEAELYTFSDLGTYAQQRMLAEWAGKYTPVFGHLPASQDGEMVFFTAPDGLRRGLSRQAVSVDYVSSTDPTLSARRTDILPRARMESMIRAAKAKASAKQSAQRRALLKQALPFAIGAVILLIVALVIVLT
jgi:hypothetical protein